MSVKLVIESAPGPQSQSERDFTGGQLVIGRGGDADWQLNDPDNYVSRRHCILSLDGDRLMATDASTGGLFIDNAANPIGTGNRVEIEPGMRLRLGDFVLRVDPLDAGQGHGDASKNPLGGGLSFDFDFGEPEPEPERSPRPETLPDPFGTRKEGGPSAQRDDARPPPRPLDHDDPFGLDLRDDSRSRQGDEVSEESDSSEEKPASLEDRHAQDIFADWSKPVEFSQEVSIGGPPLQEPERDPQHRPSEAPQTSIAPEAIVGDEEKQSRSVSAGTATSPTPTSSRDRVVFAALLRGMGLDAGELDETSAEETAERIGRATMEFAKGVMFLLRTRAQAKQTARVAQTIIANSDVNPFKFMGSPEDAMAVLLKSKQRGYLEMDRAIAESFHDLTDHQVRTWSALQTALRHMIDTFDPERLEKQMEDIGLLESLLAGGRAAKLWQLYEERYEEIARSAEKDFLGEVGAEFRDAYEKK